MRDNSKYNINQALVLLLSWCNKNRISSASEANCSQKNILKIASTLAITSRLSRVAILCEHLIIYSQRVKVDQPRKCLEISGAQEKVALLLLMAHL